MLSAQVVFILVGGLAAAGCLIALAERLPRGVRVLEQALEPPVETEVWPAQLVRLERIVGWSSVSALDQHTRLRPILLEIAEARLARHGVRLDRDPDRARRMLGPAAWELVRPGRPAPRDPDAPGIRGRELEQALDALEAL
jgi:hypothetical protein